MHIDRKSGNRKKINKTTFSFSDFVDLSLIEILTLQFLLRHSEPVVRHTLYLEVNQFLQSEETTSEVLEKENLAGSKSMYSTLLKNKSQLSTSSFYNSLKNLEKKGLVDYKLNKKGKIESIKAKELTHAAIDVIRKHFLRMGLIIDNKIVFESAQEVFKEIGQDHFNNVLLIWPHEHLTFVLLQFLTKISNSSFILCKKELFKNIIQNRITGINFVQMYNKMIREPNDIFDFILFFFVDIEKKLFGLSRYDLLKESARVAKKNGGVVIVMNFRELPFTDNEMTNQLINMYHQANIHQISNSQKLKKEMEKVGFSKIKIVEHKGLIFGLGWV